MQIKFNKTPKMSRWGHDFAIKTAIGYRVLMARYCVALMTLVCIIPDSFGVCSSGYSTLTGTGTMFMDPESGGSCLSGYTLLTLPDDFEVYYHGMLRGSETTLCTDGRYVDGECVEYTRGLCTSGNVSLVSNVGFMDTESGTCGNGYVLKNLTDEFTLLYTGRIVGSETTLCTNGRYVDGECVAYTTGDCPNGYTDLAIGSSTFASPVNDACTSTYSAYTNTTHCDHNPGETCVTLPTTTVSISWYNQDSMVQSGTCYYGDSFSVPPASERPGYRFVGWSVRN